MTDVHEPETRSYNMSRISAKDTKPEMIVRRFLTNQFEDSIEFKHQNISMVLPKDW